MKNLPYAFILMCLMAISASGQNNVGINDNNSSPKASAMLDVYSASKGLLIPRIALTSTTTASPVTSPDSSLLIYNTRTTGDVLPGYYYWNGAKWVRLTANTDPTSITNTVSKTASCTLLQTENMVFASGNISLTLPAVTSSDNGLEISVKNVGTFTDLVKIFPQSGHKNDGSDTSYLTRWIGRTFVARDGNWIVKEKETRADNFFDVAASGSFTTIEEVVAFLNLHMTGPSVVRLGAGTYQVAATVEIDLAYPVTFEGLSYGETEIVMETANSPMFTCATECYFKMLMFTAASNASGNDAIVFAGSEEYYEVKDCDFTGFNKGIVSTDNNESWIFEVNFENCAGSGVEIASSGSGGSSQISECAFTNCAIGINLLSGESEYISIQNCSFDNGTSGTPTGILYNPDTFTLFTSLNISNNTWNNEGTYISGFDFSLPDGRDANAFVINNAGMENENPHCKITLLNNPNTSAANGTTWVKADWNTSGTYLKTYSCKWNLATVNRLTYLPINKSDVTMWISGNIMSSSSNRTISIAICKNGITTTRYGETSIRTATAGQPYQYSTVVYLEDVSPTDYFELWFSTTAGVSDNFTFSDLNWWTSAN